MIQTGVMVVFDDHRETKTQCDICGRHIFFLNMPRTKVYAFEPWAIEIDGNEAARANPAESLIGKIRTVHLKCREAEIAKKPEAESVTA
jgi:hypothetical protein